MNLGSVTPYLVIALIGILVCSRITGRQLSFRFGRPSLGDIVAIAFAFYMPLVGAVIPNGFLASLVVILTAVALLLVGRRYGQPRVQAAPRQPG